MKFAFFMMPLHLPSENPALAFDRDIDLINYAEQLDYDAIQKIATECNPDMIICGYSAYSRVIDFERLTLQSPEVVYDLPAGGRRIVQRAIGYRHTFVTGVEVARDGTATGALPGRLIRS